MPLPIQPTVQPDVSMLRRSAVTVPEEAIEAAARAQYAMNGVPLEGGGFDDAPESVRDDYRIEARAALAAALPVLLEELAQRIEGGTEGDYRAIPHRQAMQRAAGIVRGFAAEVTR